jgi:DNA polymerase III subunit epsilon
LTSQLIEPVVVIDFETTGLDPRGARLTEVAALRVENGRIVARFETLIDPGVPVPPAITHLTGISTAMLHHAPTVAEVIPALRRFIGRSAVVAHHGSFDQKFYEHALRRCRMRSFSNEFLCTVRLARRIVPGLESYSLQVLARHCGAGNAEAAAHRATADAEVTVGLLTSLLVRLSSQGIHRISCDMLRQIMKSPIVRFPDFLQRMLQRQAVENAMSAAELAIGPAETPQAVMSSGSVNEPPDLPRGWVYSSTRGPHPDLAVAATLARRTRSRPR